MKFLGIDLSWSGGWSGVACLTWSGSRLELTDLQRLWGIPAVLAWVDAQVPGMSPGGVGVDAPTLIPNATGMRLPDRLAHRYFGRYDAGCYPANLARPFAACTVGFGESLLARGFVHAPTLRPRHPARWQIEVFPHPAQVRLFGLPRILKYKKGPLGQRRSELGRLRDYLQQLLPTLEPPLALAEPLPGIPERLRQLKAVEDQLDSLVCAYVAAHWWYWGLARNQVLGDTDSGYLVVPRPDPMVL
ncbi:MAG: DUF429 domain-containing protein [Thermostichales cyanobacterium BF4_bins_65]